MRMHIHIHYGRDARDSKNTALIARVLAQFRRGGNFADDIREYGVEDLMRRYNTDRETAQELYNQIGRQ